ncbi:MAG: hypothetical protein JW760_14720 [Spirochaetales bacterium]|nr:hypothetical protein [Spirochaetales bacterium]
MSIELLGFAEPFFTVKYLLDENEYEVAEKSILVNLSEEPVRIQRQGISFFQSVAVTQIKIHNIKRSLLIEDYECNQDLDELFRQIKETWTLAYDATKEERHRGVALWRTEKIRRGDVAVNMCYADTVPLNVGLHKSHWGGEVFKEVHTQIVGLGKMQQYLHQDLESLYLEETMAPGGTHRPMYDEHGNYPWHQYETITAGIFMPIEMQLSNQPA